MIPLAKILRICMVLGGSDPTKAEKRVDKLGVIWYNDTIKEREALKMFEVYGKLTGRVYVSGLSREMAESWIRWHREIADFLEVRSM